MIKASTLLATAVALTVNGALLGLFFVPIPEANRDVIIQLIGALMAGFNLVLGYYFGSTKGAADKNQTIAQLTDVAAQAAAAAPAAERPPVQDDDLFEPPARPAR